MQELEKILEELNNEENRILSDLKSEVSQRSVNEMRKYVQGLRRAKEIIRAHLSCENTAETARSSRDNDGWIPVDERLPKESLNSMIGWDDYRNRCVFVQYYNCRWVLGNGIEPVKIVAWRPLPEEYHQERSQP